MTARAASSPIPVGLALAALALAITPGCATRTGNRPAKVPAAPVAGPFAPSERQPIGRVLGARTEDGLALIDLSLFHGVPPDLESRELLSRHPDSLAETGRLLASPFRRNLVLGARIISGSPAPGDEVVALPAPTTEPPPETPPETPRALQ